MGQRADLDHYLNFDEAADGDLFRISEENMRHYGLSPKQGGGYFLLCKEVEDNWPQFELFIDMEGYDYETREECSKSISFNRTVLLTELSEGC